MVQRRGFLVSLLAIGAAPAVVRASSLMPSRVIEPAWAGWTVTEEIMLVNAHKFVPVRGSPVDFETTGSTWLDPVSCKLWLRSADGKWTLPR